MASKTALGELVNTLVGSTSSSLDHVEDAALIRSKAGDLPGDGAGERDSLGDTLWRGQARGNERKGGTKRKKKNVRYTWHQK